MWRAMEQALWDWLGGSAGYVALGLREFRGHTGDTFPIGDVNPETAASTDLLPAISTEPTPGALFGDAGPRARAVVGQIVPVASITLRLIYPGTRESGDRGFEDMDAAMLVVLSRVNGSAAHRTGLGSSGVVTRVEVGAQSLEVVRVEGRPVFWVWSCPLLLEGAPTQV